MWPPYFAKAHPVDLQILHDTLNVVAGFSKWNPLDPIDRIDIGITRIAILGNPLLNAPSASVVTGEAHNVGAAVLLQERGQLRRTHLRVVDRVRN